ncbi:MAG TPA: 3D domain-containing protein [Tepidisphaeraceae bacterium]|jgi:3D (Asp-Asp-Asp) domain-containing protein|nr:3D domain-containing protein [Tepidisphaeraceae bacterium]
MTDTPTKTSRRLPQWAAIVAVGLALMLTGARSPVGSIRKSSPAPVVAARVVKHAPAAVVAAAPVVAHETLVAPAVSISVNSELLRDVPTAPADVAVATVGVPTAAKQPRVIWMQVTAYCACKKCCGPGAKGLTASGRHISYNGGHFVAADTKVFAFGTKFLIPGYAGGNAVEVVDRGGAIKGNHIDLFMPTHQQAVAWGNKWMQVTVAD